MFSRGVLERDRGCWNKGDVSIICHESVAESLKDLECTSTILDSGVTDSLQMKGNMQKCWALSLRSAPGTLGGRLSRTPPGPDSALDDICKDAPTNIYTKDVFPKYQWINCLINPMPRWDSARYRFRG